MPDDPAYLARLAELRQLFVDRTHREAAALEETLRRLESASFGPADAEALRQVAHGLAGGLSVFGFDEAAAQARAFGSSSQTARDRDSVLQKGKALVGVLRQISV